MTRKCVPFIWGILYFDVGFFSLGWARDSTIGCVSPRKIIEKVMKLCVYVCVCGDPRAIGPARRRPRGDMKYRVEPKPFILWHSNDGRQVDWGWCASRVFGSTMR